MLSLLQPHCVALRPAVYPPGPQSHQSCPSSPLMVVVDVCPTVTIKTTRAGPATTLAAVGEMSVGAQPQVE